MKVITLLFLTLLSGVQANSSLPDDCSKLEVSYSIKSVGNTTTVDVLASGGAEPYYYFFFDEKNNPLTWDFKKSYYAVERSEYPKNIKVLDAKGCAKVIEFNQSGNR